VATEAETGGGFRAPKKGKETRQKKHSLGGSGGEGGQTARPRSKVAKKVSMGERGKKKWPGERTDGRHMGKEGLKKMEPRTNKRSVVHRLGLMVGVLRSIIGIGQESDIHDRRCDPTWKKGYPERQSKLG